MATKKQITSLSTLQIHKLSQAQYNEYVKSEDFDDYAIYLTPDEDDYITQEDLELIVEEINADINSINSTAASKKDLENYYSKEEIDDGFKTSSANLGKISEVANQAATAANDARGAADAAQGDVDALEAYVGTFTHDKAKSVVEYINAKTDGIATSGNLEALGARVTATEGDIATIKGDYLSEEDKEELQGNIDDVSEIITTLVGDDTDTSLRDMIISELTELLVSDSAAEAFDTLEEMSNWIKEHPESASEINSAIQSIQTKLTLGVYKNDNEEDVEYNTVKSYVEAVVAMLQTAIDSKVNSADYNIKIPTLEGMIASKADAETTATAIKNLHDTVVLKEDIDDITTIESIKVNGNTVTPDANKAVEILVPINVSELNNDSGYITRDDITGKADTSEVYTKNEADSTFALKSELEHDHDTIYLKPADIEDLTNSVNSKASVQIIVWGADEGADV